MAKFFHGPITKSKSEELLLADGGEAQNGKFLFRLKKGSENDFILSVIYKGAPTHHAAAREAKGEEFSLNKNPTGCTTLKELAEYLKTKRPKWPVPLTKGVPKDGGGGGGGAKSTPASPQKKSSSGSEDPSGLAFFHAGCAKGQAEELLLADGGGEQTGKFLVRPKKGSTDDFILSVIYKGAPSHHNISRPGAGEEFTINKTPTGKSSLGDVVDHLRAKQPKWPVPLKGHVANPNAKSSSPKKVAAPKEEKKEPESSLQMGLS